MFLADAFLSIHLVRFYKSFGNNALDILNFTRDGFAEVQNIPMPVAVGLCSTVITLVVVSESICQISQQGTI